MNLLIDQKEQAGVQESDWTPPTTEQPVSPMVEDPFLTKNLETPLDYYNFDESEGRKRGILGPVLIIIFLLAAIGAAAYYGFFYKPKELKEFSGTVQQSTTPAAETAPVAAEPAPKDAAVTSTAGGQSATPDAEAVATAPAPVLIEASMPEGASPLARGAAIMGGILAAKPAGLQVTTLILDQNSFSVEVSAEGRNAIESFVAALKSSVPGGLTASPSSGYYSGTRALVRGSFPALNPATATSVDAQGMLQVKQDLNTLAQAAGLKVIEISQLKPIVHEGQRRSLLFVKVSGSEGQFAQYCLNLASRLPQMRLDKIILQTDKAPTAVGVLRLESQLQ